MKLNFRKIGCLCLTALMIASFGLTSYDSIDADYLADNSVRYDTVKATDVTGKVDVTSVVMDNLSPSVVADDYYSSVTKSTVQTIIFTLDKPSVIDYIDDGQSVADFITTDAGIKALNKIEKQQKQFLDSLKLQGISYELVDCYNTVINAVAVKMSVNDAKSVSSLDMVIGSEVSETYAFPESVSAQENPSNIYGTGIYDTSKYEEYGKGVTVAILDTGLDYTHEAFQTQPTEVAMEKSDVESVLSKLTATKSSAAKGKNITADDLYISAKIPFAYDYADKDTDVYPSYSQHGVHVAGIIAGQADSYTDKDGNIAKDADGNVLSFRGSAPNAQLVICKVFTDDLESDDIGGATTEDIIAALEDCVTLGVDVINMSLGTSAGFSSVTIEGDKEGESLNKVYKSIQEQGISLMCAASNDYSSGSGSVYGTNLTSNPDSGTVGSPSTFDGAMSVASINGVKSPYMIANGTDAIFFEESSDANGVQNDFIKEVLGDNQSGTFSYVVIPGVGRNIEYTTSIQRQINKIHERGEKVIAVVKRGETSFKDKVTIAAEFVDAVIIYNNVAGSVRMNLEDSNKIPAISVSIDAGAALVDGANSYSVGTLEINKSYKAGPFMNDYSSWGVTPDLHLKPDITSHGGEITSTVAGGYTQMSGTSMATPNLAGLTALVRSYAKQLYPDYTSTQIKEFVNQLMMSTATTVYSETGVPYSPRKQGSGLAVLENIMTTGAYLYTKGGVEEGRPKIELGEDDKGIGEYTLKFFVNNFGDKDLTFGINTYFFTETVARGGLAVAEKPYYLDGMKTAEWTVGGKTVSSDGTFTVENGKTLEIVVKITMSDKDKSYIKSNFKNGMFVEGFLQLISKTEGQCDLNLPYMGFYGDWEAAELLDYDCYEIAEFKKDTSLNDNERPQANVWATQAYAMYYNNEYIVPMGSYTYLQDENADQIYTNEDYAAISCYNEYYGENNTNNYMTTTGLKALYAGLLRNAELVTYDIYDDYTGELIKSDSVYRVSKAYAGGGSAVPANVLLEYTPADLGLVANGKYKMDFHFYFYAADKDKADKQDNTFSMTFYVDYEAPLLVDQRIRYYDYKDEGKTKTKVYLDLDIYDNHYAQSLLLCYSEKDKDGVIELKLATEYVTPIYNPNKNGTTTVSLEITDFYDKYRENLYVQINDYALNYCVYNISFDTANQSDLSKDFDLVGLEKYTGDKGRYDYQITIGVNQAEKLQLANIDDKNIKNFGWTVADASVVRVKNGEIFGVKEGSTVVSVKGGNNKVKQIYVTVEDKGLTLKNPSLSFDAVRNTDGGVEKPGGAPIEISAGSKFTLEVLIDPWYYPIENLDFTWTSSNEELATVTKSGEVQVFDTEGSFSITVKAGSASATASFTVQDPFTVSNMSLTKYNGTGGVVVIPDDENIRYIGEGAFKDNETVTTVIIPKTVTQIDKFAFQNCVNLENVYFISDTPQEIADAELTMILRYAFIGCTSLKKVDLSNVKIITVDKYAFENCTALEEVVRMDKIGKMDDYAFAGCTSLKSADISGLHTSGTAVFKGDKALTEIVTDKYTVIGKYMFSECTELQEVVIKMSTVAEYAFEGCTKLKKVTFGGQDTDKNTEFVIGANAFSRCLSLDTVDFNGFTVKSIGDSAFSDCESLKGITFPNGSVELGKSVFENCYDLEITYPSGYKTVNGAIYVGNILYKAPKTINTNFVIREGTTEIAAYAFQETKFVGNATVIIPETVTKIGKGAFAGTAIETISLPESITEIPAYAFAESNLSNITIGKNVTTIGESAFYGCGELQTIKFEENSSLKNIGSYAFANSALTSVTLPDGASEMGSRVFANCTELTSVTLPSVKTIGTYTFSNTPNLTAVTFGKNSTTTGNFTFSQDYYDFSNGTFNSGFYDSKLETVVFGDSTTVLGEYAFYGNKALKQIDLNNITEIGTGAFYMCSSLERVWNLYKATYIGAAAFRDCCLLRTVEPLADLNLLNATYIGNSAFAMVDTETAYSSINIPNAVVIEDYAFYGGNETQVTLPNTVEKIGNAAFGNSKNLTEFVCKENENFFTEDGVLYRNISDGKYELVCYPSALTADEVKENDKKGVKTYSVKTGTASIQAYAFSEINNGTIQKVILPYSVKTIGDAAFYASGITEYQFESINAPTLLYEYINGSEITGVASFTSLLNKNFEKPILYYAVEVGVSSAVTSPLKLYYPTNGIGYDNYVYSTYFVTRTQLGELEDDLTREAREAVEGFVSADVVKTWTEKNITKAEVEEFAEAVKSARAAYNNIRSDAQKAYFENGKNKNLEKLEAIETALKTVKKDFGITVNVASLSVAEDSAHETEYKVGQKFNAKGLKIIITYDDYTTEVADMSQITISTDTLGKYDRTVTVSGYGKTIKIPITVVEGTVKEDGGCNSLIGGNAFMVSIVALVLAAGIIITKKVSKKR